MDESKAPSKEDAEQKGKKKRNQKKKQESDEVQEAQIANGTQTQLSTPREETPSSDDDDDREDGSHNSRAETGPEEDEQSDSTTSTDLSTKITTLEEKLAKLRQRKAQKEGTNGVSKDILPKDFNITMQSRASIKEAWKEEKPGKLKMITALEIGNLQMAIKYVYADTKRHKRAWVMGFFTVFLVVVFVSLLQNAISKSPIIFLKLSEDQVGEYDLVMTATLTNEVQTFWINYTEVNERIEKNAPLARGSVPRWVILGRIYNAADQTANTSTAILIIDSEKEEKIGLGRGWKHPVLGRDEVHVTSSVLRALGLTPNAGDTCILEVDLIGLATDLGALPGGIEFFILDFIQQNFDLPPGLDLRNTTVAELLPALGNIFGVDLQAILEVLFGSEIPDINLNIPDFVKQLVDNLRAATTIRREFLVMDGVDNPSGKYPKALGNVATIESKYIHELIQQAIRDFRDQGLIPDPTLIDALLPLFPPAQREALEPLIEFFLNLNEELDEFERNFHIDHYAFTVITMYNNRFETYVKDQKGMNFDMIAFTNEVSDALGFTYPVDFTLPLYTALIPLYYIRLFLDQIFTFVTVVLVGLGAMLIYSLLLSNVEEKTYEYGMLRAMGMQQYVLIELLVSQSLSFSLPAIVLGLLVSFLIFIPIAYIISDFALSPIDVSMDGLAATIAVLLGLFMPLIAIIAPIRRALSRTLRDALDIYHQVQSETTVRIIKLEALGLSPWQISASLMMVIMGFIVYYVIPYAFTFGDLPLFFLILIMILLGMLFGLSLIGTILQPFVEKLIIYLLMWGKDYRSLSHLVRKNLGAHGNRNIKTAIMFTTSLAFIIFAGSSFSLQGHTISESVQLASGSDLMVLSLNPFMPLDEARMREYLDQEMARKDPIVVGYTFTTTPLNINRYVRNLRISNLAGFPNLRIDVVGVEENYLDETYVRFYRPTEISDQFEYERTSDGKEDVVKSLYTHAGQAQLPQEEDGIKIPPDVTSGKKNVSGSTGKTISIEEAYTEYVDVIVSEALRLTASVDTSTPLKLTLNFNLDAVNTSEIIYLAKARAMVRQMPGFFFSSYRQTAFLSTVIVSVDQFYRMMKDMYYAAPKRDEELPEVPDKQSIHIRLKEDATKFDRELVKNGLRNFIEDDLTQIIDTTDVVGSTKVALDLLTVFFNVVSVIATILCFFVLWLSFTANVRENAWEFGVLRAVGLNSWAVIRMYIYEALCLIVASVLIGTTIGMLVSITLTLQFNLFTELAFTFDFPYYLFFSVLAMSVLVAFIGSYLPADAYRKKDIALVLKNM